jgi:VanZ family protein
MFFIIASGEGKMKTVHKFFQYNFNMVKVLAILKNWGPFTLIVVVIFIFSSIPKRELPDLAQADIVIKKGAHMVGYFLLALSSWYGLRWDKKKWWLAWLMAVIYACTDEFHQSFVPGRTALLSDVAIDSIAAGVAIFIKYVLTKYRFPGLN